MTFAVGPRPLRRSMWVLWHMQRIKRLVRAQLATDAVIMVAEIHCCDPACPGTATQITILGFDLRRRVLVLHRPLAEVSGADLDEVPDFWMAPSDPRLARSRRLQNPVHDDSRHRKGKG